MTNSFRNLFFFKCGTNYFKTYLISRAISELGNSQTALAFFTTEPDRICGSCNFILSNGSAKTFQFLFFSRIQGVCPKLKDLHEKEI